jgi:hypothetical protein
MRATAALAGGGRRFFYPKTVWSPAGGWWNSAPPNAGRAGAIAVASIATGVALVFNVSRKHEVSPARGRRRACLTSRPGIRARVPCAARACRVPRRALVWYAVTAARRGCGSKQGPLNPLPRRPFPLSQHPLQRRPVQPDHLVPSELWCTHAEIDNPSLRRLSAADLK